MVPVARADGSIRYMRRRYLVLDRIVLPNIQPPVQFFDIRKVLADHPIKAIINDESYIPK